MSMATQPAVDIGDNGPRGLDDPSGALTEQHAPRPQCPASDVSVAAPQPFRLSIAAVAVAVVALVLALLPGRAAIPPLIESDYCYLLTAADRFHDGHGLTATSPVAPFQPWTWQSDWTFLTRWPVGYPLMISAIRSLLGISTVQACQWINVLACASALVGWFVWISRSVPPGVTRILLAAAAAGCSVSVATLTNPSTDAILLAVLPWILLFVHRAVGLTRDGLDRESQRRAVVWLAVAGLLSGGLFWVRYASVFVPLAVGAYLLLERRLPWRICLQRTAAFSVAAAGPIAALLLLNTLLGGETSAQAQLNLGSTIGLDLSLAQLGRAWWRFTDLGYYDYRLASHWFFALWPAVLLLALLCSRSARATLRGFLANPCVYLSAIAVIALLFMLIGATALFGDKFDYVGLGRYYQPVRPLYFLLFAAPLALIPHRAARAALCLGLFVACSWTIQQEWSRTYNRRLSANHTATPYGRWSRSFEPGASQLYGWLKNLNRPELVVVSNFHEFITLETGIPALSIPPDTDTLDRWIGLICAGRGITDPHVLFVLESDNGWRDYWIPKPAEVIRTFGLSHKPRVPDAFGHYVYDYAPGLLANDSQAQPTPDYSPETS